MYIENVNVENWGGASDGAQVPERVGVAGEVQESGKGGASGFLCVPKHFLPFILKIAVRLYNYCKMSCSNSKS